MPTQSPKPPVDRNEALIQRVTERVLRLLREEARRERERRQGLRSSR